MRGYYQIFLLLGLIFTTPSTSQIAQTANMSKLATLPDGEYAIVNKTSEFVVGRNIYEDRSGGPMGIFTLEPSVGTDGGQRVSIPTVTFPGCVFT